MQDICFLKDTFAASLLREKSVVKFKSENKVLIMKLIVAIYIWNNGFCLMEKDYSFLTYVEYR